jgi:hypothetical protein
MHGLSARINVKRSQGDHGPSIELRNGSNSEVLTPFRWPESNIIACAKWLAWDEPRAVGDLEHVETVFARNLGDLIRVRHEMPDRLMKATAER